MTLNKAIGLVSDSCNRGMTTFSPEFKTAQKLCLEAAIRIRFYRWRDYTNYPTLLPGETPE